MRCYQCMKEYDAEYDVCPHCGFIASAQNKTTYQLAPGTRLQGRYYIGIVLGTGGFGITYKAYDEKLGVIVAIKEYYPVGMVKRIAGETTIVEKKETVGHQFQYGLNHFLGEARSLAQFADHPNIVQVYHYFAENQTGYIVMEYLEGVSMRYFLEVNEERISILYAKEIVLSAGHALAMLHRHGVLHRDISPDNIFLCTDGKVKLIDFGTSRWSDQLKDGKSEVIVKLGYAPIEQYTGDEKEGPYTDVYALGATFYRAITGVVPPPATERCREDMMLPPSEYNEQVPEYLDAAIMKAVSVDAKGRFQNMDDFIYVLEHRKVVKVTYYSEHRGVRPPRQIRCMGCMRLYSEKRKECPFCASSKYLVAESEEAIPIGTVVQQRYTVGAVIRQKSDSKIYIGWDNLLAKRVAVEEYFCSALQERRGEKEIKCKEGIPSNALKKELDTFIEEGRELAAYREETGFVRVYDTVRENGTAYIIMEYESQMRKEDRGTRMIPFTVHNVQREVQRRRKKRIIIGVSVMLLLVLLLWMGYMYSSRNETRRGRPAVVDYTPVMTTQQAGVVPNVSTTQKNPVKESTTKATPKKKKQKKKEQTSVTATTQQSVKVSDKVKSNTKTVTKQQNAPKGKAKSRTKATTQQKNKTTEQEKKAVSTTEAKQVQTTAAATEEIIIED